MSVQPAASAAPTRSAQPGPATAQLTLNDQVLPLEGACTLAQLLAAQGLDPLSVATAVNGQFVARSARAQRTLAAGDAVTTFQAIVGG